MKKVVFSIGALVLGISAMAFTFSNFAGNISFQKEIKYIPIETKSFNAASVKTINAQTINGDIKIIGDAGGDATVAVSAYGQKAEKLSAQDLQALINKYWDIQIDESGDGKLSVIQKAKVKNMPESAQINFLFEIHASASVAVDASSVSGDVSLKDLRKVVSSTVSGDLALYNIAGNTNATSVSGDITGLRIGAIEKIHSVSGDIILNVRQLNQDATINTVSGDVRLKLAKDAKVSLNISTVSGDLDVASLSDVLRSGNNLSGSLNGGGNKLNISTVSGDVKIASGNGVE